MLTNYLMLYVILTNLGRRMPPRNMSHSTRASNIPVSDPRFWNSTHPAGITGCREGPNQPSGDAKRGTRGWDPGTDRTAEHGIVHL
jgi:hypothetical protein